MKTAMGIIRPLDALGRIVIPKEYRKTMNLENDDPCEMIMEKENGAYRIVIRKYVPADPAAVVEAARRLVGSVEPSAELKQGLEEVLEEIKEKCPTRR